MHRSTDRQNADRRQAYWQTTIHRDGRKADINADGQADKEKELQKRQSDTDR